MEARNRGFERLGDILHRARGQESSSPMKEGKRSERVCGACGQPFEDMGLPHRDCPACRAARLEAEGRRAEEARVGWLREVHAGFRDRARFPRGLWEKTLESWKGKSLAFTEVRRYAEEFPLASASAYPSLFLYSKANGLGKSHLVAACANRIFDRWLAAAICGEMGEIEASDFVRCPVLYHTGPDLLVRVRSTYNIRPDEAPWRETEAELYDSLKMVPLLVLDDLGKEAETRASDHTQRVYFQIIDGRYLSRLPLVVCSNLDLEEVEAFLGPKVGPAVKDRLIEMTHDRVMELRGKSYRKRMWAEPVTKEPVSRETS